MTELHEADQLLDDPRGLLAMALARVRAADDDMLNPESTLWDDVDEADLAIARTVYRVASAFVLTEIAKNAERLAHPATLVTGESLDFFPADLTDLAMSPVQPQAVNGVRYVAELSGLDMGTVGNQEWLYVPGHGFVDVSHANETGGGWQFIGRVVSATPDHVLLIDDGGRSHTLPRALITEVPDDAR